MLQLWLMVIMGELLIMNKGSLDIVAVALSGTARLHCRCWVHDRGHENGCAALLLKHNHRWPWYSCIYTSRSEWRRADQNLPDVHRCMHCRTFRSCPVQSCSKLLILADGHISQKTMCEPGCMLAELVLTWQCTGQHSVPAGQSCAELGTHRPEEHPHHKLRWQVDAAVLKLHSRRCTCLEFHPFKDNLVLSGDKKGQVLSLSCGL